nr:uncharacterized protein LOC126523312 isoform X1 [Dermacentor andersoni]
MGRYGRTVSSVIVLALCLGLTVGSFLYCSPPNIAKGKHAVKKMRVSGATATLMKNYRRCLHSNSTRKLMTKYGFDYNLTTCNLELSRDDICNNPDLVAEYYDCFFKQQALIMVSIIYLYESIRELRIMLLWSFLFPETILHEAGMKSGRTRNVARHHSFGMRSCLYQDSS